MILQKITIQNFGSVLYFSEKFSEGINILKNCFQDEIAQAISIILRNKSLFLPSSFERVNTRIEGIVFINGKSYLAIFSSNSRNEKSSLKVYDERGKNVTEEYIYETFHCNEHDESDIFDGNEKTFLRFLKYSDELYIDKFQLSEKTEGYSNNKSFRSYLKKFIDNYAGETIREGKQFEIFPEKNGSYNVRYKNNESVPVTLSESEQILFRFLCFLKTAEFWKGFEKLRNINGIEKPLIVKNFLSRLDESIDVLPLLERTSVLERQVIILN